MRIRLGGDRTMPMYRQIADAIRHQVATGALEQGARLPTVRGLAEELKVDRNTVVRAYRVLDRDGVISSQRGRGTFVNTHPEHPQLARHRREHLRLLMSEVILRALSLGYSPAEIRQTFAQRMGEWERVNQRLARRTRQDGHSG